MGPIRISLYLSLVTLSVQVYGSITYGGGSFDTHKDDTPPMVAFMCNKPAMHLTDKGWVRDETTDCLKDPVQILDYCKSTYPNLDITNVVETDKQFTIDNWCKKGHTKCRRFGTHTVTPYKCLVGAFQSDALLVPEHCVFDHIHEGERCQSPGEWGKESQSKCTARNLVQQSYSMLLPCGVDMFSGVEFVCCPKDKATPKDDVDNFLDQYKVKAEVIRPVEDQKIVEKEQTEEDYGSEESYEDDSWEDEDEEDDWEDDDWEDTYDYDEDEEDFSDEEDESTTEDKTSEEESEPTPEVKQPTEDAYNQYLHNPNRYGDEHEYFNRAKSELQKHHHEKITKMMKEWSSARTRVQEMKATDPKAAEKLNREITARFQKTYEALEQEGMAEKKQLVALHQQRVQAELNEKKRHAMEHYMASLQKNKPDASQILKSLKHYVKTEQKDRMHSVNHFKHLRDTDPVEAERVRQQTLDHLQIIHQRIQQSIQMLDRVPDFSKKIQIQIDDFLKSFSEIDVSISNLLVRPAEKVTDEQILEKYKQVESDKANIASPAVLPGQPEKTEEPETEKPTEDLHRVPIKLEKPVLKPSPYDDEVEEDEHASYIDIKPVVAHQSSNAFSADQTNYVSKKRMLTGGEVSVTTGSTLGIAVGCIAVFVIIVIGIVVLRRKAARVPVSHGFVEVDQASSPEERHVANMQINGYENPTYKYFEMNGNNP